MVRIANVFPLDAMIPNVNIKLPIIELAKA